LAESQMWAIWAGLGLPYMVAFATYPNTTRREFLRPGIHGGFDAKVGHGIGRLQIAFSAEDWIAGGQTSPALVVRLGFLCCRGRDD
jgi:hypothetical protein